MRLTWNELLEKLDELSDAENPQVFEKYLLETISSDFYQDSRRNSQRAALYNELGGFCRARSIYKKSEDAFLQARQILLAEVGKQHPDYATTINNLAGLYRLMGDYDQSRMYFEESIQIYADTLGKNHFLYTSALNNLGLLYQDMKQYESAASLYRQAIEILQDCPDQVVAYATSMSNLALACMSLNNLEEAESIIRHSLELYEKSIGRDNGLYAAALNNLAQLNVLTGKFHEAIEIYLKIGQIYVRTHNEVNRDCATTYESLAILYAQLGDSLSAATYHEKAQKIRSIIQEESIRK